MLIVVESSDSYPVSFYLYSALHLIILLYLLYFIQFSRCNLVLFSTFYVEMTRLVGLSGLEPPTSRLSGECSNRLSYKPILVIIGSSITFATGGDKRDRTVDPLLAKQVLSQLSYTPIYLRLGRAPSKLNNVRYSPKHPTSDLRTLQKTICFLSSP